MTALHCMLLFAVGQPVGLDPWAAEPWAAPPLDLGGKQVVPVDLHLPPGAHNSILDIQSAMWKESYQMAVRATDFTQAHTVDDVARMDLKYVFEPLPETNYWTVAMPKGIYGAAKGGKASQGGGKAGTSSGGAGTSSPSSERGGTSPSKAIAKPGHVTCVCGKQINR